MSSARWHFVSIATISPISEAGEAIYPYGFPCRDVEMISVIITGAISGELF
jgi:hypothetical protein